MEDKNYINNGIVYNLNNIGLEYIKQIYFFIYYH